MARSVSQSGDVRHERPNLQLLDAAARCGHLIEPIWWRPCWRITAAKLFPDEPFGDLFLSGRERPSVPADVIASVMVLQALECLSARDAAGQLRTNIAWKVACGLAIDDPGFRPIVLTL